MSSIHIQEDIIFLGKKLIGKFIEDKLVMSRDKSIHFYRNLGSWCLNYEMFKLAKQSGKTKMVIMEVRDTSLYVLTIAKALEFMDRFNNFITNVNEPQSEPQVAFPQEIWDFHMSGDSHSVKSGLSVDEFLTQLDKHNQWTNRIQTINKENAELSAF